MIPDRVLQGDQGDVQPGLRAAHLAHPSPYLTLAEGAVRYRFDVTAPKQPVQAFREWLNRHAVPVKRRGRAYLVEVAVVDAVLEG